MDPARRPATPIRRAPLVGLAIFTVAVFAGGSSAEKPGRGVRFPTPANAKPRIEVKDVGLTLSDARETKMTRHPDGRVTGTQTVKVTIDKKGSPKGKAKGRTLSATFEDQPLAKGGQQMATIVDGDQTATFTYSPYWNSITIAAGEHKATILQNPDHSYWVDGQDAATGRKVVDILADNPAYQAISPHSLMLAYSIAQSPNQAARVFTTCEALPGDGGCQGDNGGATPPAVCTLFNDFCECAICDKAGKGRACAKCK